MYWFYNLTFLFFAVQVYKMPSIELISYPYCPPPCTHMCLSRPKINYICTHIYVLASSPPTSSSSPPPPPPSHTYTHHHHLTPDRISTHGEHTTSKRAITTTTPAVCVMRLFNKHTQTGGHAVIQTSTHKQICTHSNKRALNAHTNEHSMRVRGHFKHTHKRACNTCVKDI